MAVGLFLLPAAAANAASPSPAQLQCGKVLLTKECGASHAEDVTGASPVKATPATRSLGQRYPVGSLEEALAEGLMTAHPEMPEFPFDADDVGAIIA